MKKIITLILTGVLALSLVACGTGKPSLDEVKEAIANGTLTVEDALEKGYIDIDDFEKSEPIQGEKADNKLESNLIGDFDTTTISGEGFANSNLSAITYFAFLNPNAENAKEIYDILSKNYKSVKENGGEILIITLDDENNELFADSEMSVVHYNDSFKAAMGSTSEMVNEDGFVGTWNVAGAFPMAWSMKIDADEDFITTLNALKEMLDTSSTTKDENIQMDIVG